VVAFAAEDVGTSLCDSELDRNEMATLWALVANTCRIWIEEKGARTPKVVQVALGRTLVRMAVSNVVFAQSRVLWLKTKSTRGVGRFGSQWAGRVTCVAHID
jgi:hypothetical protein